MQLKLLKTPADYNLKALAETIKLILSMTHYRVALKL